MNQHFKEGPPEAVGAEEDAYFKVERAVEEPVEHKHHQQDQGDMEGKVIHRAGDEQVALPLLVEVRRVGLDVVEVNFLDGGFDFLLGFFQPDDHELLFLNKLDGLEHYQRSPVILISVVVVQPQIVDCQEQGLDSPPLDEVEHRPDLGEDVEGLILNHTLPILIFGIELGTLDAIGPSLIASLAFSVAVLLTDSFL